MMSLNQMNSLENSKIFLDEPDSKLKKYLQNEFIQYRTELANASRRISMLEDKYNQKMEELDKKILMMDKSIVFVKENIVDLLNKLNLNSKYTAALTARLETESENNVTTIKSYDELVTTVKKLSKHLKELIKNTGSFQGKSNDIIGEMQNEISNNHLELDRKLRALKESLISQLNSQNKEIDNFESHILTEFNGFVQKVKGAVEEQVNKNRTAYDFTTSDVELIRNKNEYLELSINKLRNDLTDSIKQAEIFLMNKVDRLSQDTSVSTCACPCAKICKCCCCNNS